jgi:hypothetical protein
MGPNPVPVGIFLWVDITDPTPIYSDTWSGGTGYSSYSLEGADPNQPPPSSVSLGENVTNVNTQSYGFIIDNQPRTYEITVTVQYVGGGSGTSTLTVTSALPPFETSVLQAGNVDGQFSGFININGQQEPTAISIGENSAQAATEIDAETGAEPNQAFNGEFMWLQTVNSTATIVSATPQGPLPHTRQTTGTVIDDGYDGVTALGQSILQGADSWPLETDSVTEGTFVDAPKLVDASHANTNSAMHDQSITYNASYETYLMYQAPGGVWIALQEYTWNFQITDTNTLFGPNNFPAFNWVVNQPNPPVQPNPSGSVPSGTDAFPVWTNQSFGTPWNPPF